MPEMARLFRTFDAVKDRLSFDPAAASLFQSPKVKLIDIDSLFSEPNWAVDRRFWTKEEKVSLGIFEEKPSMTEAEFFDAIRNVRDNLSALLSEASND